MTPIVLNVNKMYSYKDFQTFWFRYKTEGEPHGISINSFCINQGVPYKQLPIIVTLSMVISIFKV